MCFKLNSLFVFAMAACCIARTVKVTEFAPSKEDATAAIQAAIYSGADVVEVDNPGFEYLVMPIKLVGNQEVVFKNNVVVRAMPGEYKQLSDSMFTAINADNLVIRGEGNATLRMNKKDYQDASRYKPSEWRHAIVLRSSRNVIIRDLRIESSGGDGVYLGAPMCKDVLLENLVLDDHHRQGISVITAENVMIRRCTMSNTSGTAPMAGIDFEPNRCSEPIINNVMEDCDIFGNAGFGIDYAVPFNSVKPLSITVRNCRVHDNKLGCIRFDTGGDATGNLKGFVKMEDCTLSGKEGTAIVFRSPRANGTEISFKNCVFDNSANPNPPIFFRHKYTEDIGGIDFGNTVILQGLDREVFATAEMGIAKMLVPAGSLTIKDGAKECKADLEAFAAKFPGQPEFRNFASKPLVLDGLKPANANGAVGNQVILRNNATFLQYASPDCPAKVTFEVSWARYPDGTMPLEVIAPDGTVFGRKQLTCPKDTYELKVTRAGVYRLVLNTGGRGAFITSDSPGCGFVSEFGLHTFRSNHDLYFEVPADLTEVKVELVTDPGEAMAVDIFDENGNCVLTVPRFEGMQYRLIRRKKTQTAVLWRYHQHDSVEDNVIRFAQPIEPILYASPENWLKR